MLPSLTPSQTSSVAQRLEEHGRFCGGPEIRLRDDLDERHAAAVVVDIRVPSRIRKSLVQRLACVLFHVHAGDADPPDAAGTRRSDEARARQRLVVLRDLIALGEIRIEVVLPREHGRADYRHPRASAARRQIHGAPVQHGQRPGQPETHRAHMGVWRVPESRSAAAENLGPGQQLGMNLEANDGLERRHSWITSRRGRSLQGPFARSRQSSRRVEGAEDVAESVEKSGSTPWTCPATLADSLTPLTYVVVGPAALTSSDTSAAYVSKFALNMPARRWAWAS